MPLNLRAGQQMNWGGNSLQVLTADADHFVLISDRTRSTKRVSMSELEAAIDAGEIKFSTPPIDLETAPLLFADNPESIREQVSRRRRYVDTMMLESKTGCRRIIAQVIKQVARDTKDPTPPSVTAVYDWTRAYKTGQNDITRLIPRHAGKGNREPRLTDRVLAIFDDVMDRCYLNISKPTAAYAHEHMNDLIRVENKNHPKAREKLISYKAFTTLIRRRVDPYWKIRRREGVSAANRQFRGMTEGIVTTYPLERVEIDHTVLDVMVKDPVTEEVIGRPTLTWALDHYSRVVLGFIISFESPKTTLVLECLKQVMQDKTPLLAELGIAGNRRWNMHGRPNFVVLDNGAEFHSFALKASCAALQVSMQYCPPGKPWFKGRTERFPRTLNQQLVHMWPGTTRSNSQARGDYKSAAHARMTIEDVRTRITRYIVQVYHERHHSTLGMTPRQAWEEGVAEHPPSTVRNPATLEIDCALTKECTISGSRIQFENLCYSSPALAALRLQLPKGQKVKVALLQNDISVAHVFNPITKTDFPVTCGTRGVTSGMTFDTFKLLRKAGKKKAKEPEMSLVEDRLALEHDRQQLNKQAAQKIAREKAAKKNRGKRNPPAKRTEREPELKILNKLTKKEAQRLNDFAERTPPPEVSTPANTIRSPFDYSLDDDVI